MQYRYEGLYRKKVFDLSSSGGGQRLEEEGFNEEVIEDNCPLIRTLD